MFQRSLSACALALALVLPHIPASAQGDRRAAAEAYARVVDYPLLIEKAATRRAAGLPASERAGFIEFITREVDFEMTRFYATSAMVDLFEAGELQALVSFAARRKVDRRWPSCLLSAPSSPQSSSDRSATPSAAFRER